jgi:N-acetylmuramoyl-L-alanine amidase
LTLMLVLCAALPVGAAIVATPSGSFTTRDRRVDGQTWVCAQDLASSLKGTFGKDDVSKYPVMIIGSKRILVSTNSALASVDGKIYRLQHVPLEEDGCLWLPPEFLTAVLPSVVGGPVSVRSSAAAERPMQETPASSAAPTPDGLTAQADLLVSSDLVRLTVTGTGALSADARLNGREFSLKLAAGRFGAVDRHVGQGIVEALSVDSTRTVLKVTLGDGFRRMESLKLRNPDRLVVIFKGEGQVIPQQTAPAAMSAPPEPGAPPTAMPTTIPSRTAAFDVVVIDPGHGGSDTGALSSSGLQEKDLTLIIAQKLAALLESQGIQAILTRNTDTLVPLTQRTALANFNQADLFLSIHLNSSPAKSAHGTETYYLSRQATDLWASQLAEKENAAGPAPTQGDGGLNLVLWQLAQTSSIVESATLAETIQEEFNSLLGTSDRGVRQAPFVVLEGASMPAVLVEVAFLSNPTESKELADEAFQDQIASALDKSILSFKARYENPAQTPSP